jgi:tetratricopeptide (TPR) repeat protein
MRSVLRHSLFACLCLAFASARGEGSDPSDVFLDAYLTCQRAEKLESAGNLKAAFAAYQQTVSLCDQVTRLSPNWNPPLIERRRGIAAAKVAQLQPVVGKAAATRPDDDSLVGSLPSRTEEPIIPGTETFVPPKRNTGAAASPKPSGNPLREVQDRLDNLEDELAKTKGRLDRVTREKAEIAKKYEEALKTAEESAQKQIKIEKRASMLEDALMKAEKDGVQSTDATKEMRTEIDRLKVQLRDVKIDRDAETEIREQLAQSLTSAKGRIATATGERDAMKKENAAVPVRIAEMQKEIDKVLREKGDLTVKLSKVQEQLGKVTTERDDAMQQVVKMKEAQKQVDKLLADNTQLMAKLGDAETQIKTFKAEGADKEKQIAALKTEMTGVKKQLADAQKQSSTYQTQMSDLQGKLDLQAKELAQLKTDVTTTAAERKRLVEENEVLRGIVVRQMKQQAVRDKTKQLVLTELAKLEVNSKALIDQIEFLGQPVVKLSDREKKLFKQPTIEISDAEISIAAPKELTASAPVPQVPADAAPAEPKPVVETNPAPESKPLAETKPAPAPEMESKPPGDEKKPTLALDTGVAPDAGVPGLDLTAPKTAPTAPKTQEKSKQPATGNKTAKGTKPAAPLEEELPAKDMKLADAKPAATNTAPAEQKADEPSTNIPATTTNTSPTKSPATGATEGTPSADAASPAVPPELLAQAREAKDQFDKGNYRDAEKIYEKILTKAPSNLYILSNLGVVRFRGGKLKLAEEAFKKAIAIAPEDAFSHCTLGIIYYSQGKYDEAVNELTKALAVNPKNATAHNYLGITASQKGWQEAAQKELETATTLDPQYADAHFNLAVVFATQQPPNKESARRHYKLATELGAEPDSALEQLIK